MGAGYLGTPGGGAVWIRARRRITHNGVIAADGLSTAGNCRGAGAGGGFLVEFAALNGNGIFRANGGASTHTDSKGGGSGGLIALWTRVPEDTADLLRDGGMSRGAIVSTNELPASFSGTFEANVSLKGGSGGVNAMVGEPGTFCWLSMPPGGTLLMLR